MRGLNPWQRHEGAGAKRRLRAREDEGSIWEWGPAGACHGPSDPRAQALPGCPACASAQGRADACRCSRSRPPRLCERAGTRSTTPWPCCSTTAARPTSSSPRRAASPPSPASRRCKRCGAPLRPPAPPFPRLCLLCAPSSAPSSSAAQARPPHRTQPRSILRCSGHECWFAGPERHQTQACISLGLWCTLQLGDAYLAGLNARRRFTPPLQSPPPPAASNGTAATPQGSASSSDGLSRQVRERLGSSAGAIQVKRERKRPRSRALVRCILRAAARRFAPQTRAWPPYHALLAC